MSESTESVKNLAELFAALDTALSLHYFSSTIVPKAHDLCEKATQLTKRRVDVATIERILSYDPQAYHIVHFGAKSIDYGVCIPIAASPLRFSALLSSRKKNFEERLISTEIALLPSLKLSEVAVPYLKTAKHLQFDTNLETEPTGRVSSSLINPAIHDSRNSKQVASDTLTNKSYHAPKKSPSKVSKLELFNNLPRFTLKKTTLPGGLSLIERIKLKEKRNKIENEGHSAQENHILYIKGKAPAVYEILYELTLTGDKKAFKTIPTKKLISIIKDSLSFTMTEEEIDDTINELAFRLPEKIKILRVGEVHALKILSLNRNLDLSVLNKTV